MRALLFCSVTILVWAALQLRVYALAPSRLRDLARQSAPRAAESPAMDLSQALIRLVSAVTAGGSLRAELERMAGRHFARSHVAVSDVEEALRCGCDARSEKPAARTALRVMSCDIVASARLSEALGCPVSTPLSTVERIYRHTQRVEELRATAFSMPKSTVKLLAALPAVTLMGGELLGARPLTFLFGTSAGGVCLAIGAVFWVSGILWMRTVLHSFAAGHGS